VSKQFEAEDNPSYKNIRYINK